MKQCLIFLPASGSAAPLRVFLRYGRRDFCFVRLLCDVASPCRFRLPRATRGAKEVHMWEVDLDSPLPRNPHRNATILYSNWLGCKLVRK